MSRVIRVLANDDGNQNAWAWTDAEPDDDDTEDPQISGWVSSYDEVLELAEPDDEIDIEPEALDQMASFRVGRPDGEHGPD